PPLTHSCRPPLPLPPFPTRRSSDLLERPGRQPLRLLPLVGREHPLALLLQLAGERLLDLGGDRQRGVRRAERLDRALEAERHLRSEEHTSELQSRENLVCRLLLEKK